MVADEAPQCAQREEHACRTATLSPVICIVSSWCAMAANEAPLCARQEEHDLLRRDVVPADTHCVITTCKLWPPPRRRTTVPSLLLRSSASREILYHSCKGSDGKKAFGVHSMELNP